MLIEKKKKEEPMEDMNDNGDDPYYRVLDRKRHQAKNKIDEYWMFNNYDKFLSHFDDTEDNYELPKNILVGLQNRRLISHNYYIFNQFEPLTFGTPIVFEVPLVFVLFHPLGHYGKRAI